MCAVWMTAHQQREVRIAVQYQMIHLQEAVFDGY
jgi:hypothetical protein